MANLREAGQDPEGVTNLTAAAGQLLDEARNNRAGRAARTLLPGAHAPLKQTLVALLAGERLDEHESPSAASLHVLAGRVRLVAGDQEWNLSSGDHVPIPPMRHSLDCIDDAVLLLTVTQE